MMVMRSVVCVSGMLVALVAGTAESRAQLVDEGTERRSIFSALDTQGRTVAMGADVAGSLTESDVVSAGGRRVQVWTLGTSQGQEVQVDLRSDDFDAFLYVVGPGLQEGIRDDDGGSGLNSRICFVPDRPGEYRVVASSLNGEIGDFTMSALATNGSCGGAVTTNEVTDLATLDAEGRTLTVGGEFDGALTDRDALFYGSPVQAWAVQGSAGEAFSVDLISDDFDAYLTLLGPGLDEVWDDDDGAGRCDSRISLTFPASGEYLVVASTLGTGTGAYMLRTSRQPGPRDPDGCIAPVYDEIDEGGYEYREGSLEEVTIEGALAMESSISGSMRGNEGYFRDRPLQGWTLEGTAGSRVAITLTSDQFDTYLFFDGPGFVDPLSDDDSAGDLDSRICVELPETGTYRIFAGPLSSASNGAPYRLEATVADADDVCGYFEVSPLLVAEVLSGLDTQGRTIGVNEEQTGTLTGDIRHPESGRPVQPWELRATPGTFLYVDVVTDMYDAYLYVIGEGIDGALTADDHGGTLNPRLELTIPESGVVTLLPSAFSEDAVGNFLLRVSTNPPPMGSEGGGGGTGSMVGADVLDGITTPVAELPMGGEYWGNLGPGDDVISRGYAQAFSYQGRAGEEVVFEVVSDDFDTYMYLEGPGFEGVLSDDDGGDGLNSRIEVTLPATGTYRIVASALSDDTTGSFRVRALRIIR